jgi:cation diffusion facilitator family transporter
MSEQLAKKVSAARLSVASNSVLVVGKLGVGVLIGSVSVISEALHSGMDLLAAFVALYAVRGAEERPDREHPFGHGKLENLSGVIEGLLVFAAAAWIVYEAVAKLLAPYPIEGLSWGIMVMGISAIANLLLSDHLFRVARDTESVALDADAWHLRTDVYTCVGVVAGLGAIMLGERLLPAYDWHWLDPAAAIAVAVLMVHVAWKLTRDASRDLMDTSLPPNENEWLREYVTRPQQMVHGIHDLRTRRNGPVRFVEFHLIVHGDMSVDESHHLTDIMTSEIKQHFPGASVIIHVEPCDGKCEPKCVDGCLLSPQQRDRIRVRT